MSKYKDISGIRFARLLAIKREPKIEGKQTKWSCLCDCGKETSVYMGALSSGKTKSCGCLQKEIAKNMKTKHGMYKTNTFITWAAIRARCLGKYHIENYRGRGIMMCDRWVESFDNFLADMGERPDGLSIDRIDNDGDYTPDNCRWATKKQQGRNIRKNVLITHNGETLCIAEWAERLGMEYKTLQTRISRGWSDERAITTPVLHPRIA